VIGKVGDGAGGVNDEFLKAMLWAVVSVFWLCSGGAGG